MSMLNHLSALTDRAIRATTPFSPRYSVALIDRRTGRPHTISGIPLVVMSPKSLLRHPQGLSYLGHHLAGPRQHHVLVGVDAEAAAAGGACAYQHTARARHQRLAGRQAPVGISQKSGFICLKIHARRRQDFLHGRLPHEGPP